MSFSPIHNIKTNVHALINILKAHGLAWIAFKDKQYNYKLKSNMTTQRHINEKHPMTVERRMKSALGVN